MIKLVGSVRILMIMEQNILVNGSKISNGEKVDRLGSMESYIRGNIEME